MKGMKIPLHLDLRKEIEGLTYSYLTVDKKTWSVRVGDFNNVTLDDFKGLSCRYYCLHYYYYYHHLVKLTIIRL